MNKLKNYKSTDKFYGEPAFPKYIKVPIYKYYIKLPNLVECYECGHKHWELERKGFIKTGYKRMNVDKSFRRILELRANLALYNGFNKTYTK